MITSFMESGQFRSAIEALSRDSIIEAAMLLSPGDIGKWTVELEGRRFPVMQLIRDAANRLLLNAPAVTPADLTAHDARDLRGPFSQASAGPKRAGHVSPTLARPGGDEWRRLR